MIEAYVGLPGSGKTLHAVKRLIEAKAAGRKTLANFHSQTGSWDFALWQDIAEAGNCLAVIDEAHMWFSARTWTKTNQLELSVFQQHRKEGVDLIWIAQHEARVDVAIREVTAFIWKHRKLGGFCAATQVTPDEPRKPLKRSFFKLGNHLFRHYFTEERIGFRDGEGYGFGGGEAFRRSAGSPTLDSSLHLRPNLFRIETPEGAHWVKADRPNLAELVGLTLAGWSALGVPKDVEQIVSAFYRGSDGKLHELKDGELLPIGVSRDSWVESIETAFELAHSVVFNSRPKKQSNTGCKSASPDSRSWDVRAQAVAKQGLAGLRSVLHLPGKGGN